VSSWWPAAGKIKHDITTLNLDDINDKVDALGRGDVVGREVVVVE
jgi:propanol-preferring alcohol dehydrogenase